MAISDELRDAIKRSGLKQYVLARAIGVHPATLSGWLTGAYPVQSGDKRVLALADIVRVHAEKAFADEPTPESLRAQMESRSQRR